MVKLIKLRELCSAIVDCPHTTPNWLSTGTVVLRNFNLVNGFIDMTEPYFVDEKTYVERTRRMVPKEGDIVFSREAPVGNCAIIPPNFKCCLGQRLVLLRPNRSLCSPEYLLAMLNSSAVRNQIEQVEKTGSTVSNFNIGDLRDLQIPYVEDPHVRERITLVYSSLMRRVDNNNKIRHELNNVLEKTFQYWFLQYNFPNENDLPYANEGGQMHFDDRVVGAFPASWSVGTIGSILKEKKKSTIQVNQVQLKPGTVPFFTSGDEVLRYADKFVDGLNIFMSTGGNFVIKAFMGPAHYSTDTWCVHGNQYSAFLYLFLKKNQQRINDYFFAGSGLKHLQKDQLKEIFLPIPDLPTISLFNKIAMPLIQKVSGIMEENYELLKMRDYLLPLLISGQLEV